jgi:hypothetical protein
VPHPGMTAKIHVFNRIRQGWTSCQSACFVRWRCMLNLWTVVIASVRCMCVVNIEIPQYSPRLINSTEKWRKSPKGSRTHKRCVGTLAIPSREGKGSELQRLTEGNLEQRWNGSRHDDDQDLLTDIALSRSSSVVPSSLAPSFLLPRYVQQRLSC